MVSVTPNIKLVPCYIFKDSKGNRQTLRPAESLESNEPQLFDGSDALVAEEILARIEEETVEVSRADKKILLDTMKRAEAKAKLAQKIEDATLKAVEADASGEKSDDKSAKKAVADAHAEYDGFISPEDHQAAIDKAVAKAEDAGVGRKAIKNAVSEVRAEYKDFVSPADHKAALAAAGLNDEPPGKPDKEKTAGK